jgi:DNA-binding response OmpR family regulator
MSYQPYVLVIDDDPVSSMALQRILAGDGYQVRFAADGIEGLQRARETEPDLILLDVVMPGLDGFEVCQTLRSDRLLGEVPVVMVTSLEDKASRLRGLEAGADDFLSKPFLPEELRARVRSITRLNRYRRLRTERERFGWVVEQAEDGYLLVGQGGELRYANERARCLLGWAPTDGAVDDVLGHLRKHFSPHPEEAWRAFPQLGSSTPLFLWRPESERAPAVWLEVKALQQATGNLRESLLRLRDVTHERSSRRSVWSFETVVAHKLRTPLTRAGLGLTFLRKKAHKLTPEQVVESAEQAHAGLQELKLELERVLAYVNSPRAVPQGEGFSVGELPGLIERICLSLDIPTAVLPEQPSGTLHIDPRAFELAVWEVLNNCRKFHPRSCPRVQIELERLTPEVLELRFRDDGCRLSPHQLDHVFDPYFQGEKTYSGQVPGMGLGLATLRAMLWEVGGDCALANRVDEEGVMLTLRLRLQPGQGEDAAGR